MRINWWGIVDTKNGNVVEANYSDDVLTISCNGSVLKQYGAENWRDADFTVRDWCRDNNMIVAGCDCR